MITLSVLVPWILEYTEMVVRLSKRSIVRLIGKVERLMEDLLSQAKLTKYIRSKIFSKDKELTSFKVSKFVRSNDRVKVQQRLSCGLRLFTSSDIIFQLIWSGDIEL